MATTEPLETYEILRQHQIYLGPDDDVEEAVNKLPYSAKSEVRDIREKYSKSLDVKHISTLINASKLSHDTDETKDKEHHGIISKAFVDLHQIEDICPVLKVVSCEKVKILFDFKRNSTDYMDPTTDEYTSGVCYHLKGEIRVGAKGFLKTEYLKALGVLAHELTHYAMSLVYGNKCKPFHQEDPTSEEEFKRILTVCEEKKDEEDIISQVFDDGYADIVQQAELIVRVPQIFAHYKNDFEKIGKLKDSFKDLFSFYSNKTMFDLNREFDLMMARKKVEDLNSELNFSKRIKDDGIFFKSISSDFDFEGNKMLVIESNCTFLSIRAIHQTLSSKKHFPSSFIFIKLFKLLNDVKVYEKMVETFVGLAKPWLIVDCEMGNSEKVSRIARKLRENELTERVCFIQSCSLILDNTDRHELNHYWSELTEEKQEIYLETGIRFQGKAVKLKELLSFGSEALGEISLNSLIKGRIVVGKEIEESNVDHYISRFFETEEKEKIDLSSIISKSMNGECILLSSFPGMGKSTELMNLSREIKKNFPSRWVVHMALNLEKYTKFYEAKGQIREDFKIASDVIEFFCGKIMRIKGFEAKVFEHCFNEGKVVVILDGLDEISPNFLQFTEGLMNSIRKNTKNCLWISTRPHLEKKMNEKLKASLFRLCPLSRDDQLIYLKASLVSKNIPENVMNQRLEQIERLFANHMPPHGTNHSSSRPLILWIVAEEFEKIDLLESDELENMDMCSFDSKFLDWCKYGSSSIKRIGK